MTERRLGRVTLDADVRVPRRDGAGLLADVYRPLGGGRHPALVLRLPYDKRRAQSYWYAPPSWYAERGFAVVVEDVRGRHRSPGDFVPLVNEAADGADLLRWVAGQPWCDGSVGMYGYSYCGLAQLLAAGADSEVPLAAIAPALAPPGLGDGCLHVGGVQAASFTVGWAIELDALRLDALRGGSAKLLDASSLRELVLATPPGELLHAAAGEVAASWLRHWLALDPADDYWRTPSHLPAYERVAARALHLGGLYDTFRAGAVEHYLRLRSARARATGSPALGGEDVREASSAQASYPQVGSPKRSAGNDPRARATARAGSLADQLAIGPWTHQPILAGGAGPLDGPDPAAWQVDRLQLDFFEAVLRGGEPPAGPGARVAVLNSHDTWTGASWPPASATVVRWHLTSRGRANGRDGDGLLTLDQPVPAPPDHLVYNHANPVPAAGGDDCGDPDLVGMGPADQARVEQRPDVLVYTSAPAGGELVAVGDASATLFVDTADRVSHWLVRICLVNDTGTSVNLAEGVTRHDSGGMPGPHRVDLPIGPVAFRVGRGQRLRVHVTNGSAPRWGGVRDPDGRLAVSRSVVLHDPDHPSCLTLREVH